MQIILPEEADWVWEHREWQEQFQRRTRKQYPAEFWDKSRRGKVQPCRPSMYFSQLDFKSGILSADEERLSVALGSTTLADAGAASALCTCSTRDGPLPQHPSHCRTASQSRRNLNA